MELAVKIWMETKDEIKWNKNFPIDQRVPNGNGGEIKQDGKAHKGERNEEGSNGNVNSLIGRNGYEGSDGNECKVKWKGNVRRGLEPDGNGGETMTGQSDADAGVSETKWNGNGFRDQDNIDEPDRNGGEIKRNANVIKDRSGSEELDENDAKCDRNVPGSSDHGEKVDKNGDEIECSGKNLSEKPDGNKAQQNKDATKHQKRDEPNNGFPRKTKTLGLLCRKFFLKVLEYIFFGDNKINLETIASSMEVEKRRIYDVVNVMEALGAMKKSHKSFYTWKGLDNLPSTLHALKIEADEEGIYEKVLMTQHIMTRFMEVPTRNEDANNASPNEAGPSQIHDDSSLSTTEESNSSGNNDSGSGSSKKSGSKKKENKRQRGLNSLTYLCRYFFKILIVGLDYQPDYKVSLDVASTILIKDPEIDGCKPPDRSRCRRIYDVANVLISLRLIERRMFTFGTKKIPLFVYCGPKIIENGQFDFFHHIRFNKLSVKLKNSEEKRAYEVEEENLEAFFRKQEEEKNKAESSNDVGEPTEKRSRIEETDPIQESVDFDKENVSTTLINQIIPSQGPIPVPAIRPQPQLIVQEPRFPQFVPPPFYPQGFLPFDPRMILLNSGNLLHNVNSPRTLIQQNNFNYLSVPYPLSSIPFFQQPYGATFDTASAYYATSTSTGNSFIHPENIPRPSAFNIDSILGARKIRGSNQVPDEMRLVTSTIQHPNPTGQNSLLYQCS
ncbi:hypothetical protein LOAG_07147 [Loa loa]|uniref:E2F/DP family winged-helix DNA-binding domain-containing protein n=1 Tax=Loa loa TaxID=7209 RepID=A0A1S0TWW4_LOALO|nr:hypothetical protein LOAG_07147 [Loa loa]EFO21341.1 hypothetical protein LOAG_07147 [Loa loa]